MLSHLTDPATAKTLTNGITIHYTNVEYEQLNSAVLEARKFKNN